MKKKVRIIFLLFLCVHLGYLCFLGTKKINFHIDEYFTYALSNKEDATMPMWPHWEEEKEYVGDDFFLQEHAPSKEEMEHFTGLFKEAGFHNVKIGG